MKVAATDIQNLIRENEDLRRKLEEEAATGFADVPYNKNWLYELAVRAQNRNLGLRPWQAGTNQQEPQPRFLRRLCARVHQMERLLELA